MFSLRKTQDGPAIDLPEGGWNMFVSILLEKVIAFYENPQTRDSNSGLLGSIMWEENLLACMLGATVKIGMQTMMHGVPPPELVEFLNRYK